MKKRKIVTYSRRNAWAGRMFVAPFYIGFLFFFLYALVESIVFVFNEVEIDVLSFELTFVKWENIRFIFQVDPDYSRFLVETLVSLLWQVPVVIIASLFIAQILKSRFIGRTFVRSVFFLPVILGSGVLLSIVNNDVVAGSVLSGKLVSSGDVINTISLNAFLTQTGLSSGLIDLINTVYNNMFGMLWKSGIQITIFLAALQGISPSLYEASAVEGSTAWEDFWKITLPMIHPVIMLNIFFTIIESTTDSQNNIMQKVLSSFNSLQLSLASAMSWTYFLFIALILAVVAVGFRKISSKGAMNSKGGLY